ncbi:MAG: hypothetical protein ACFFBE_16025 [Promethearchaeota archaeon]
MKHSDEILKKLKVSISVSKNKESIEKYYYQALTRCLKTGDFDSFKKLFNASVDFDIFIDVSKIPKRFDSISELLLNCTKRILNGYQISALGDQIDILRACNDFNLLETELTKQEIEAINKIKKDELFLNNLFDLFGRVSDSFLCYVYLEFPRIIYNYIKEVPNEYFSNLNNLMYNIKTQFFNQYTIYGLSVRNLSTTKQFMDVFKKKYAEREHSGLHNKEDKYMNFGITYQTIYYGVEENHVFRERKDHFIAPINILSNLDNILDKKSYNFYSISMVLLGGLGPQGLGFTYSTPKGEIIEICSDQKETEAIVIKFKQYLKKKFLNRLQNELSTFDIRDEIVEKIVNYLSDTLNPRKKIDYYDRNLILNRVKDFLDETDEFQLKNNTEIPVIIKKISKAISLILRDIELKDQFMARMDLVAEGKIRSEDIAKLTSLKGKSHYDVLRERFFWQYIVDKMYEFYIKDSNLKVK